MADVRIVQSPVAEDDLIEIWCLIAADNSVAADRFLDMIGERIWQIALFPDSGAPRPDIARDARALTVGSYLVLYGHRDGDVEIVRVVHGARDVTALF